MLLPCHKNLPHIYSVVLGKVRGYPRQAVSILYTSFWSGTYVLCCWWLWSWVASSSGWSQMWCGKRLMCIFYILVDIVRSFLPQLLLPENFGACPPSLYTNPLSYPSLIKGNIFFLKLSWSEDHLGQGKCKGLDNTACGCYHFKWNKIDEKEAGNLERGVRSGKRKKGINYIDFLEVSRR